jgi:putative nucleotidyltransferase with HDIG domain
MAEKAEKEVGVLDVQYPLMALLREKCPGTYNHSKNIALILESIGAELDLDIEKLKMAAYYHDIGKTRNPLYFIENQDEKENPHDELEPWISYKIIVSHVSDSVIILLNDPNIPREVIEWISQHHGDQTCKFFYDKALVNDDKIEEEVYQYPGAKPNSLEASLLMLTDHLEARIKSLIQADKLSSVAEVVDEVFEELLNSGQLDNCPLPKLGHIRIIKDLLKRELSGNYHKRIDYEEAKEEKDEKKK